VFQRNLLPLSEILKLEIALLYFLLTTSIFMEENGDSNFEMVGAKLIPWQQIAEDHCFHIHCCENV